MLYFVIDICITCKLMIRHVNVGTNGVLRNLAKTLRARVKPFEKNRHWSIGEHKQ
jgi:hypothetical protein